MIPLPDRCMDFTIEGIAELGGCMTVYGNKLINQNMEHELVLWKLKDYTNHMWIEETILMLMEITGHLGHGGWRVHPVCKIHTGELAIVVLLPPDSPGYYNIRPPRLLLYNMKSKICRICSFDFPKFTSGYRLNPAFFMLRTSTMITLYRTMIFLRHVLHPPGRKVMGRK